MDPTLFPKLLPHIFIDEKDKVNGGVKFRLVGSFLRDIHHKIPIGDLDKPYYDNIDNQETLSIWLRSDEEIYLDQAPNCLCFDMETSDGKPIRIGEICLPIKDMNGDIINFGFCWKVDAGYPI